MEPPRNKNVLKTQGNKQSNLSHLQGHMLVTKTGVHRQSS